MFYFLISKGDGSFCFLFCYRPIEIPPQQPRHRLLSHHRQPIVLADGQVTRWSPMGEEAHGVAFLLGGVVDQSPLLQGLVDMGGVETFQWVTGLVLLEYLAEEGKLTLFLVGRDIIAIGIDVTKQGNI
jgi:hypothetical protein